MVCMCARMDPYMCAMPNIRACVCLCVYASDLMFVCAGLNVQHGTPFVYHICVRVYGHANVHVHEYVYVYMYVRLTMHMCARMVTCVHVCHIYVWACLLASVHVNMHTRMHM